MNEKQQTAVQWLIEQILVKQNTSYFNMRTNDVDLSYYVNKALEMEREQREEAYSYGEINAAKYFIKNQQF